MMKLKTIFSYSTTCGLVGRIACRLLAMGVLLSGATLVSCSSGPKDVVTVDALPEIYPDYTEVTIPVDMAPLNFSMASDSADRVDVEVKGSKDGVLHVQGDYADFPMEEWHALLDKNRGGTLTVTVIAEQDGQWTRYRDFPVYVSEDSLGAWGVTYRRIAPGYVMYGQMGLYQRCLNTFEETELIENTRVGGDCMNCHTANRTNPAQYVFHDRGEHGATAVCIDGNVELLKAKNDSLGGSMVYPYWHPGGRYCAFSTNKTSQMFHLAKNKRIEVYDSSSDVFVYDTKTHRVLRDTLIMKKYWAENTPAFSPDGRWLYFTTARRQLYPVDYDKEKYSLCRVSFDAETGKIGTQVDTLINTRVTGKSVTWPRPSYDGRYLMYTQVDYGYFSIWHPEADLWLLDLETGETRPLDEVNSQRAESFHNWTADSRWFLFTSRRDDGLYTRLYFSYIDKQGKATKPFLMPQQNPKEYYRQSLYSYNTPDFTSRPVTTRAEELSGLLNGKERAETY